MPDVSPEEAIRARAGSVGMSRRIIEDLVRGGYDILPTRPVARPSDEHLAEYVVEASEALTYEGKGVPVDDDVEEAILAWAKEVTR